MEGLIWVHNNLHGSNVVNQIMRFITFLGDGALIWVVTAIILLFFKRTRMSAIVMIISLGIGFVFNDFVLKNIFNRPRPFEVFEEFGRFVKSLGMELPSGKSFPSGHSFLSFNCAVTLMLFNKKIGFYTIPVASAIALSRIFLCVHYPTDVLAGVVLGVFTAVVCFVVYKIICRKIKAKERSLIRKE